MKTELLDMICEICSEALYDYDDITVLAISRPNNFFVDKSIYTIICLASYHEEDTNVYISFQLKHDHILIDSRSICYDNSDIINIIKLSIINMITYYFKDIDDSEKPDYKYDNIVFKI